MRVSGGRASTSAGGGGVAGDSSEASEDASKTLVVTESGVGAIGDLYLSAKTEADVTSDSMLRKFPANVDLISRLHGSGRDEQGSTGLAWSVVLRRFGGGDSGLL